MKPIILCPNADTHISCINVTFEQVIFNIRLQMIAKWKYKYYLTLTSWKDFIIEKRTLVYLT